MGTGVPSLGGGGEIKQQHRVADHSSSSNAEVFTITVSTEIWEPRGFDPSILNITWR
jgi:hypothetical protein